jgi:hypothetical protein
MRWQYLILVGVLIAALFLTATLTPSNPLRQFMKVKGSEMTIDVKVHEGVVKGSEMTIDVFFLPRADLQKQRGRSSTTDKSASAASLFGLPAVVLRSWHE